MVQTTLEYLMERSRTKVVGLHQTIADKALELVELSYQKGYNIAITQGLRTFTEQNALYAQGRTKPGKVVTNAKGGQSIHNYGLAFDFCVFDGERNPVWSGNTYNKVGALGKNLGLEWGGDWKSFKDLPHFEYTFGLTLKQLQAGKRPPGLAVIGTVPNGNAYLDKGDQGTLVKGLQGKLQALGFNIGSTGIDGFFGVDTENAVKAFQKKHDLTVDGIVGQATQTKLDAEYKALQNKQEETPPKKEEPKVDTSKLPVSEQFKEEVKEAVERGITNAARPRDVATREEAMAMAKRAGDFQEFQVGEIYKTFVQVKDKLPLEKPEKWEEKFKSGDISMQETLYFLTQLTLRSFK
ncbi:M15 family metallopeptidase [Priestia filamentosa]|uniref:peptidoglycan-binding protein n=1 Tax=Priestia filamentosa TaxID=1402861 RepID=UPI003981F367